MALFSTTNLVDSVIDEIALEGLDGITLEALWDRIALRFHEKTPLSRKLIEQIWNICLQVRELSFYELENERNKLIIFDRYEFVDPDLGIILEPDVVPDDMYEHCPIDDWKNGIKGSCSSYYTRNDITDIVKNLNIDEAEKNYERKLVIVASQATRQNALMDKCVCPILDMTVMQYCFLERVGRSRYQGEVTQGKLSLALLKEDPRSLFYHRKFLLRHRLVTKQTHHQKSGGHSYSGSLLHLPRFYVERKPKVIFLAEKVIDILKSRDNQIAEYSEIKKELRVENSIKKLFKTSFFQKVVKTDLLVPWRTLYPHATNAEWQCKNNSAKEKMLRVVQLLDPNVDINDLWKDEVIEEDDPFELDISEQIYSVPFLRQANAIVEKSKHDGLGQTELAKKMGLTKLHSRTIFRNLAKTNIVATFMNDIGRQRVTKYVSRKFESSSRMSKQFKHEMCKMKKLTEIPLEKNNEITNEQCLMKKSKLSQQNTEENKENDNEKIRQNENMKSLQKKSQISSKINEKYRKSRSFDAATKILHKYKLTSCQKNYKRTFNNVADMKDEIIAAKRRKFDPPGGQIAEMPNNEKSKIFEFPENFSLDKLKEKLLTDSTAIPEKLPPNDIVGWKKLANPELKNVSNVTYRLLKRANMIIESVKEHKVIDDMTKLIKAISEEEEKEGYDVRIDKRSLVRLLQRLAKDNLVKNIKLTLSTSFKEKTLTFICDPSIDVNHTVIRSAVEQAKIKFCLIGAQKVRTILQSNTEKLELSGENTDEPESIEKLNGTDKEAEKILPRNLVYDAKAGRRYGYAPKFIRMQALHSYLFYIIYEHPGKPNESKEKLIDLLRTKGVSIDENLQKDMSDIFNTEVGWKMFVPPLPIHNGWPTGWALMSDLLLRMPLSIFLKIHKVSYAIPELEEWTNHPLKKHLLVKDMPAQMRNVLLIRRKYIFSIHETISRLSYVGLLQFGPQKFKEKDQVFVYLNRKTELLDTTTSAAHYHKIEDKIYPVIKYNFTTLQSIDKYWYKLWTICVNTRLGGRLVVQGKDIVLEDLAKKNEMIEAMKPKTPEEAQVMDIGQVPGDRMGAAGIDSAFFAHLKRNWNWESSSYPFQRVVGQFHQNGKKTSVEGERETYLAKVKPKPLKFTEFHGLKRITGPVTVNAVNLKKSQNKNSSRSTIDNVPTTKKPRNNRIVPAKSGRQRSYVRRVLPRRCHHRARVKYDDIDYSALQRMDKLRVDWEKREDNILLVCKVAMMYLCPNPRRQLIGFTAVRDILRAYSLTSHNKTSRACQRRLLYMLKKPETHHSVTLGVEELKQNFYVNRRFGDIVDRLKKEYRNNRKYDDEVTLIFRDLVAHIAKKHYDITDIKSSKLNFSPSTIQEFNLFHRTKYPTRSTSIQSFHDDSTNDIHSSTINSVIHSSMCCVKDRKSWAYQLFRIYQQYPEWLLRSAMAKIRTDQMVSIKKDYVFAMKNQSNNCMPMSSSQYQLSSGYVQKFNTKLPFSVFNETWHFFRQLGKHYNENFHSSEIIDDYENEEKKIIGIEITPVNGGSIAAIHDYINIDRLDFDLEIPRHIIMLDPTLERDDERYIRIARRYQDILRNLEHFHMHDILDRNDFTISTPEIVNNNVAQKNEIIIEPEVRNNIEIVENLTKLKNFNNSDMEMKKNQIIDKIPDKNETNVNTDTETFESEHEINFDDDEEEVEEEDDDEDFYDQIDDIDNEDDDFICFLDGTKIHLTCEDIERSGLKENINSRSNEILSNNENKLARHESRKRIRDRTNVEESERKKIRDDDILTNSEMQNSQMDVGIDKNFGKNIRQANNDHILREDAPSGDVRVNELINRAKFPREDNPSYCRTSDQNDVRKRYTRIALLKMREELNDLTSNDSHHAHEYFVLNMFKIFYSFRRSTISRPLKVSIIDENLQLPSELLPLDNNSVNFLIGDLKKFSIFPKSPISYGKFCRDLEKNDIFKRGMDAVYEYVRDKREVGASLLQLMTKFYSILGDELYEILSTLKEGRLVLRSGVKNTRYIHQKYADPWLIHSYKIMRRDQEAHQGIPAGSLYVIGERQSEETRENKDSNESVETIEQNEANEESLKKDSTNDPERIESGQSNQRKMQKSRTCMLQTKDIYRAAKQLNLDTAEEIRVVVRPWIRIDGNLNRRVLDRMLGGILAYCLMHPGVYLTKIQEKFAPAIQPFHTKELVEILMRLGCLKMGAAKKKRVTLFSKSSSTRAVFSGVPERCEWSEEELVVEPVLGATLKFSMFLSSKSYTTDFLS